MLGYTDFALPGEMGLKYERYYNTATNPNWNDNFSYWLDPTCQGALSGKCHQVSIYRPDGSTIVFNADPTIYSTWTQGAASLTHNADGTFVLKDEDSTTQTYSAIGQIQSIVDVSGIGWTFTFAPGVTAPQSEPIKVTHTNGQYITINEQSTLNGSTYTNVITVTDPGGNVYTYKTGNGYAANAHPTDIASVTYPGTPATVVTYKYGSFTSEGIERLTEIDYNGTPYAYTSYDNTTGYATSEYLADNSQQSSIQYVAGGTGIVSAAVTNPLGHTATKTYNASNLLASVSDTAVSDCGSTVNSRTYDSNGFLQQTVDNNGNVHTYTYAANGQLQTETEASGTTQARTTDYVWDPNAQLNRLTSVTVEGWSKTAYTYNAQNRLASLAVTNLSANGTANQTLTTTYNYTLYANGMVQTMSVTHPSPNNSDTDVTTYDALGNVSSFADGLGHTTTNSNYNGLNEVQHVVGPNGDATDYTYDTRGRIATKTTHPYGVAGTWTYTYDGFGLLYTLTTPDNEVTTWNRNAEMMVQTITHNDKDGTSTETFGYDPNGDVTSHVVTRGSDVGLSETAQYDALGRLYQKIGNNGQTVTYGYDGNGNVLTATNAAGHVVTNQYDHLDRVSQTTETGGASPPMPTTAPTLTVPATSTTGAYTVTWTTVSGATRYIVQEQANGGGAVIVANGAATSWGASGKANGTYAYQVKACNSTGCGPLSAAGSVTVNVPSAPTSAPSLTVPASSTTGSYSVTWTSVANTSSYTLQERLNGGSWTTVQSAAATSWNASGRASGSYGYQVQACNAVGCGPWSAVGTITVSLPAVPSTAPALTVPATNGTGSYSVSWGTVNGAATYTVQQQVNGGGWTTLQNSAATSVGVSGETNGSYGYRVQGCNISGCGPDSATGTTVVTIPVPIAINGQSYSVGYAVPAKTTGYTTIGFDITGSNTWQVFTASPSTGGAYRAAATGTVPSAAVTVQYTWTLEGPSQGESGSAGTVTNPAASPVAISTNPVSNYTTGTYGPASPQRGEIYQLTVTFFNAAGANISSSTCTLTSEITGTD
ncbi:YD repeat-containing protein [Rhodanobacter sp. MP1X3]|nr:YD repeat-containing protein [Rhodanobacter sp. MP1X3]